MCFREYVLFHLLPFALALLNFVDIMYRSLNDSLVVNHIVFATHVVPVPAQHPHTSLQTYSRMLNCSTLDLIYFPPQYI